MGSGPKKEDRLMQALAKAYREQPAEGPGEAFSAGVMNRVRQAAALQAAPARQTMPSAWSFQLLPVAAGASLAAVFTLCAILAALSWWPDGLLQWFMPDGIGAVLFQSGIL